MNAATELRGVTWDYSALARHYENRALYSEDAIAMLFSRVQISSGMTAVDVGAGTGRLAMAFARAGLSVHAIEPNGAMRKIGRAATKDLSVSWHDATGEATDCPSSFADIVGFGSSFNVVDASCALCESARVLKPTGWIACLWNHRDLDDPLQREIEATIRRRIPSYRLGARREDPTAVIRASGLFQEVHLIEHPFVHRTTSRKFVDAFHAHATLARQAGEAFEDVIADIERCLPHSEIEVPFFTRIWYSRRRRDA